MATVDTHPRRPMHAGTAVVAATLIVLGASRFFVFASDARDAPTASLYSALDIGDFYMFRDPPSSSGGNLVVAMTTQPLASPSFGSTYHFQSNALYRFSFSTTPDAIRRGTATASIDIVFSPFENGASCPAPGPACQTYRATFPGDIVIDGVATEGSVAATPHPPVITRDGAVSVFAGPREDPFFFDRVGFDRFIADFKAQAPPRVPHFNLFTGHDAFQGTNVSAIVIELPLSMLLPSGSGQLAAWASTYLAVHDEKHQEKSDEHVRGHLMQIDRVGNPLINTILIPAPLNDPFNFGLPRNDASTFGPTIVSSLISDGVEQTNVLPLLRTAFVPDTLKLDTRLPDGFLNAPPNGRQLTDRVGDFLLTLAFNVIGPPGAQHPASGPCPGVAQTAFSDCTVPKVPLAEFPFLGPPLPPPAP